MLQSEGLKTWLEIDKKAISSNIRQLKSILSPGSRFCGVVKANAYGHGLVEVAEICTQNGVDWLAVDSIDEAIALKKVKINLAILILGYVPLARLAEAVRNNFRLTVYNTETIIALGKIKNKKINIHIKVETGTSRQGVLEKNILKFVKLIKKYPQIKIEGISTHFANIEDTTDHSYAMEQLTRFRRIVQKVERLGIKISIKHTACSAATILFPETHFDMVRVGISLYGMWSSKETRVSANLEKRKIILKPALCWKTRIAQIKDLPAGTPVSYGLTEKLACPSKIAILPIGYWDGYDRGLSSIGNVLIRGQRAKILGRVCMNMMVVDVTNILNARVEDEVVLLGKQKKEEITAEEIAQKIGTINYEVTTRINPLIKRIIV